MLLAPIVLSCASCFASNETDCIAVQVITPCSDSDEICATAALESFSGETLFAKGCAPETICPGNLFCDDFNVSTGGQLQFCGLTCCNTSECNGK